MAEKDADKLAAADLDLVDDSLADQGKEPDELWNELDEAEKTDKADTDDQGAADDWADEGEGEGDGAAPDEGAGKAGAAAEDGDGGDKAGKAEGDAKKGAGDASSSVDIWKDADPKLRAAYEAAQFQISKLEHEGRSNRGRLTALQRQNDELKSGRAGAAPAKGAAGQGGDGGEGTDALLDGEDWKRFKSEYPEVAAPFETIVSKLQATNVRLEKELSAIGTDRRQTALTEQETALTEAHPDWQAVTDTKEFVDWVFSQPRYIQEAAERNGNGIVDAAEAADLIGRYKATTQASGATTEQSDPAHAGKDTETPGPSGRRRRQLESASSAQSRGPGAAVGIPADGDPEQIWKQFDQMEARQARA